jgi:hypothetical protein
MVPFLCCASPFYFEILEREAKSRGACIVDSSPGFVGDKSPIGTYNFESRSYLVITHVLGTLGLEAFEQAGWGASEWLVMNQTPYAESLPS